MRIGFVGLGRMGMNMVHRLLDHGQEAAAYNRTPEKTAEAVRHGAVPAFTLKELVGKLNPPRAVWVMVTAGPAVDENLTALADLLSPGDILIDGGNSHYKDTLRRANPLREKGIRFLDAGTSGGIWGLREGYCLMIGGDESAYRDLIPVFKALAPAEGYAYMGPHGAGHFVKMVHNGIEYALLQAYGEGFALLKDAPFPLDLHRISSLWGKGSVVRSWLLDLTERVLSKDADLSGIRGVVEDSGEGRWTLLEAVERGVPAPAIALALMARFRSRETDAFSDRLIAALRQEFGGHGLQKKTD
ncbi:MAG: decarboxylating 6-phosphogluconate dehydrogenase [Nitrospirae bacterium]|nr:decarboxylating 6-phosphogluconate dehydrogenase [Nitrospirota bacterium]